MTKLNKNDDRPYFRADQLQEPRNAYVAWVDVMGVRALMERSLPICSNFIFKLHVAAVAAKSEGVVVYPVMDGVFVVSEKQDSLREWLEKLYSALAFVLVNEPKPFHRFVVRGALAFGPVYHGAEVPHNACPSLFTERAYKNSLLIGMPVIQAFQAEPKAPPFGIYVHESARAFSPDGDKPIPHYWWHWHHPNHVPLAKELVASLNEYYDYCNAHSRSLNYPQGRSEDHRALASEYFIDIASPKT